MRGEFIGVWPEMWSEIWDPVASQENVPSDLFCELFREIAPALKLPLKPEELADIIDSQIQATEAFKKTSADLLSGERALVTFLENAYDVLNDLGGDSLANHYFNLLNAFITKYSLRYDLRRPCILCPTLIGVFANLVRDLRAMTSHDGHLDQLMKDFEGSVRDLRTDCSDNRIKTCISKQMNLLEALGRTLPNITGNTLGAICNQAATWPHNEVRDSIKSLYGFASDYPGIRHGGTPANAIRNIEMRDMIAMSILLVGFTPYLTERLNAETVYRGS